jgi:hypothetical protein
MYVELVDCAVIDTTVEPSLMVTGSPVAEDTIKISTGDATDAPTVVLSNTSGSLKTHSSLTVVAVNMFALNVLEDATGGKKLEIPSDLIELSSVVGFRSAEP